jgi:transposase
LSIINKLVSDELWEVVEPLLLPALPWSGGGRPRVPAREVFSSIIYVLKTGIPWGLLPREFGCSGVTCWRRLSDWRRAGVFEKLHRALLNKLGRVQIVTKPAFSVGNQGSSVHRCATPW